ncbi:hypothetical protein EDM56_00600 [Brevibacillus fluminis]|uniref:Uncharacterized protein n=1 Tax=Brevibacillus fluminis TaxID=511487 RepID=A0A3M8DX24_9BACL|nr:hypothetical protein [Brevibacillus fluminis]RNB92678.1 hypothetical protein EDM56_00600 [Brevibacillus fluminis]
MISQSNMRIVNTRERNHSDKEQSYVIEIEESDGIIASACLNIENERGEVVEFKSIDVNEDHSKEILFYELDKLAFKKKVETLTFPCTYTQFPVDLRADSNDHFLFGHGWSNQTNQHVFLFDGIKMANDQWLKNQFLSNDYTIDSVLTLTEHEKQEISTGLDEWYPARFHPLHYQTMGKNSLVLRHKGEVIGWCITCVAGQNILLYDNLFVKKGYWNMARSISLFGKALQIQLSESPIRYVSFTVHGDNIPLLKIIKKRSMSYIVDYQNLKVYVKKISGIGE